MPRTNRVTPFNDIIATPARGLLWGNRGVLHDPEGRIVRPWQVKRWIACRLEFKGWWHPPMRPNRFTGLFFLDEATAFAAGHRPCSECRHQDYLRFRDLWPGPETKADDIDKVLHDERVDAARHKRLHPTAAAEIPTGAMVALDGEAWLITKDALLKWSPAGYIDARPKPITGELPMLTPPTTAAVIRAGYEPAVHPSAASAGGEDDYAGAV
jgi:hypothetical protein